MHTDGRRRWRYGPRLSQLPSSEGMAPILRGGGGRPSQPLEPLDCLSPCSKGTGSGSRAWRHTPALWRLLLALGLLLLELAPTAWAQVSVRVERVQEQR